MKYENLEVWQRGVDLSVAMYKFFQARGILVLGIRLRAVVYRYPVISQKVLNAFQ